jgi:hypothetical protein
MAEVPANIGVVKKHILIYGLLGGLLIAVLKLVEYRFLVVEHSIEIYGCGRYVTGHRILP